MGSFVSHCDSAGPQSMTTYVALFPGQGSQQVGMGRMLSERFPATAEVFHFADSVLDMPLSALCFYGPDDQLSDTANAQPALLAVSIAAWSALTHAMPAIPGPVAVAGHSLGEYSALVVSGSLRFDDALRLVRARGMLMKSAGLTKPAGMVAVIGLDTAVTNELCVQVSESMGQVVEIANDNCPGQVVVGGEEQALSALSTVALEHGAYKVVPLRVSVAAHTSLMAPAAEEYGHLLTNVPISDPQIPISGNVSGVWLLSAEAIRRELLAQLTSTVRWSACLRTALTAYTPTGQVDRAIEVGPGLVLSGLLRRMAPKVQRLSLCDNVNDYDSIRTLLGGR